jgi:DNA-binding MurR/RpiR family transcriptional regulator
MDCLLKREWSSENEKNMADFILENAQLLRDYSSHQFAAAVDISQSSVVKFSQKLGYKGYPDLKLAVNEAVAKTTVDDGLVDHRPVAPSQ